MVVSHYAAAAIGQLYPIDGLDPSNFFPKQMFKSYLMIKSCNENTLCIQNITIHAAHTWHMHTYTHKLTMTY